MEKLKKKKTASSYLGYDFNGEEIKYPPQCPAHPAPDITAQ